MHIRGIQVHILLISIAVTLSEKIDAVDSWPGGFRGFFLVGPEHEEVHGWNVDLFFDRPLKEVVAPHARVFMIHSRFWKAHNQEYNADIQMGVRHKVYFSGYWEDETYLEQFDEYGEYIVHINNSTATRPTTTSTATTTAVRTMMTHPTTTTSMPQILTTGMTTTMQTSNINTADGMLSKQSTDLGPSEKPETIAGQSSNNSTIWNTTVENTWPGGFMGHFTIRPQHDIHGWLVFMIFDNPVREVEVLKADVSKYNDVIWILRNKVFDADVVVGGHIEVGFIVHWLDDTLLDKQVHILLTTG